jgi:hypothetical protein
MLFQVYFFIETSLFGRPALRARGRRALGILYCFSEGLWCVSGCLSGSRKPGVVVPSPRVFPNGSPGNGSGLVLFLPSRRESSARGLARADTFRNNRNTCSTFLQPNVKHMYELPNRSELFDICLHVYLSVYTP